MLLSAIKWKKEKLPAVLFPHPSYSLSVIIVFDLTWIQEYI